MVFVKIKDRSEPINSIYVDLQRVKLVLIYMSTRERGGVALRTTPALNLSHPLLSGGDCGKEESHVGRWNLMGNLSQVIYACWATPFYFI